MSFGPFEYDGASGELRKHGTRLRLSGQPLSILALLLERPNEVVGREELQRRLWNDATNVDFEHGLNAAVNKLRQTLGDSAEQPRYVQTLPGRGYRFVGTLRQMPAIEKAQGVSSKLRISEAASRKSSPATPVKLFDISSFPRPVAVVGLLLLAVASIGSVIIWRNTPKVPDAQARTVRFRIPLPDELTLSMSQTFSISPDGRTLVYLARESDGHRRLWMQSLDSLEAKRLPGTESNADPAVFWSPDSQWVAYYSDSKLKAVNLNGDPPHLIAKVPSIVLGGDWNREGTILFGTETAGIMRVGSKGGEPVPVTSRDHGRDERVHGWPTFLPDGKHFLYSRLSSTASNTGVFVGSLEHKPGDQKLERVCATPFGSKFIASPNGNGILVFQRESNLFAQDFDTSQLKLVGEPRKLAEHLGSTRAFGFFSVSANVLMHRNGAGDMAQLTWFDRAGRHLGSLGQPLVLQSPPSISPDGSQAALSRFDREHVHLWVHDVAREVSQKITFDPALNTSPIWSPNAKKIVFSSGRSGHFDLYEIGASGGSERLLYSSSDTKFATSWSSDGNFVFYTAHSGTKSIWALSINEASVSAPVRLTTGRYNQSEGVLSPDSKWIAYSSDESGTTEIYIQPISLPPIAGSLEGGAKVQISRGGGKKPHWRADGSELLFSALDETLLSVAISSSPPFRPGIPRVLFKSPGERWDVSADGKRFLIGVPIEEALAPFTVVLNWQAELKK